MRQIPMEVVSFKTELGWMALAGAGDTLHHLTFGYRREVEALDRMETTCGEFDKDNWNPELVERLIAYAAGADDHFRDVKVDYGDVTPFSRRVLDACRRIPYGRTISYARLAEKVERPGAARAVGNCMASNRAPLVVPCHRVVYAGGVVGAYSAADGPVMKRRLLQLERAAGLKLA